MNVVDGIYNIGLDVHYNDLSCFYDRIELAVTVVINGGDGAKGISDMSCQFLFDNPLIDENYIPNQKRCKKYEPIDDNLN